MSGSEKLSVDDINQGVGLSDPHLHESRRFILDLINRLHSTGCVGISVEVFKYRIISYRVQVNIDLPQIAVIGSQSTGKSSLIEAIFGVTLPRAAGTCTRYVQSWYKVTNSSILPE